MTLTGYPLVATKTNQPIRSNRLAGHIKHISGVLVAWNYHSGLNHVVRVGGNYENVLRKYNVFCCLFGNM